MDATLFARRRATTDAGRTATAYCRSTPPVTIVTARSPCDDVELRANDAARGSLPKATPFRPHHATTKGSAALRVRLPLLSSEADMYAKEADIPSHLAIVDDDMAVLRSLSRMLTACGYAVTAFQSAEAFVESLAHGPPDAVLVDLRLPGTDGLSLLEQLRRDGHTMPVVFLSGHADIPTSVRAIRAGAVDFLEKPCDESTLLASLARAFDIARSNRSVAASSEELRSKWQTLTPREQQVCSQVVQGRLNKQIAADLGTREKTIKVHRARVMAKMGARSLPELVRSIDRLGSAVKADAVSSAGLSMSSVQRPVEAHLGS